MATHLSRGLWVVLATPFAADREVDEDSLRRQVALARAAGADGLVALGVFGEAASLSLSEQHAVAACVAAESGGLPLVLGVPSRATAVAVEQARNALEGAARGAALAGSAGAPREVHLMLQANAADAATVVPHLDAVHQATGAGVVLQDYPAASGVRISTGTVVDVLAACPFVTAVKAEAPPTAAVIAELAGAVDQPVFGGLGGVGLVDELAVGAAGAMTGFSHPEGLRQALDAFADGGFQAARDAWAPWLPLATFEGQAGIALAVRKMLLHRRGVLADPAVRPPAPSLPPRLLGLLEQHLAAAPDTVGPGSAGSVHREEGGP